jgi:hypothetical protein
MICQLPFLPVTFSHIVHTFVCSVLLPHRSSEFVIRPGMNSCDFSEDETTKALHALYQMPISEGQNNLQTHASETAFGLSSADALQFGLNHKKSSSDVLLNQGKKKHVLKEKTMSGKINVQASGNNKSLNDMNQHPTDSKSTRMMSSKHSSRLIDEKHVSEEKEKQISGGGTSVIFKLIYCYFRFVFLFAN